MNTASALGALALLGVGMILAIVTSIVVLINAWKQHVVWFVIALFVPGYVVFGIVHWAETKISFVLSWVGVALIFAGASAIPGGREQLMRELQVSTGITEKKAPDLNAEIQEHRERLEALQGKFAQDGAELTKQYQQLDAQRKALKPGDTGAITKFNEAAAAYQARNTARKQMQQQMDTLQHELDSLLETRSRNAIANNRNNSTDKKIVMYTTSHCPACKAAKQYFAQKGVSYEELDVETSRSAYEEFRKLGGQGVPLILVGDKRMEGFNPSALDAML